MIKCINCNSDCRDSDSYCRNCGIRLKKSAYYIMMNIFTFLFASAIIFMVIIFIASYLVY